MFPLLCVLQLRRESLALAGSIFAERSHKVLALVLGLGSLDLRRAETSFAILEPRLGLAAINLSWLGRLLCLGLEWI